MMIKENNKYDLNGKWSFRLHKKHSRQIIDSKITEKIKKWNSARVPGSVFTDLLNNKIITNPFYADNEKNVEWVSDCDWIYETEFALDDHEFKSIVFEGLDTIAEIWLNGKLLGKTDNMFRWYEYVVTRYIKKKNKLKVILLSPTKYAEKEESKYGQLPVALNSSRVYIRKAQYSFGWDWGPSFPNAGIWKDVYLTKKDSAIIEEFSLSTISLDEDYAKIRIDFKILTALKSELRYEIRITNSNDLIILSGLTKKGDNELKVKIHNPRLWFPNGCGEQNLYKLELFIYDKEKNLLTKKKIKAGIRKAELVLKENGSETFRFKVNNKDVFAKGANWIPVDTFLDRPTEKDYEELIIRAKEANMNILRVWGGGIYEKECFYELCDKHGLMVWQDFMFACGAYPEHKTFLDNITQEIRENVARLRNHPSVVLWCGNNENEWIWTQEQSTHYSSMPGYNIYHDLIPKILKQMKITEPYWESSPFGNDSDPNSQTSGNRHQWYIWSFWKDYNEVVNDNSNFVSEFGFQGPANRETLESVIPVYARDIQHPIVEHHNKQVEGQERVIRFLSAHLPINTNWEDYIYLTQLNQGLALKKCLEHWRCNDQTNGAFIWQINDVWEVISWSLIDSNLLPKISYHSVKESFSNMFSHITVDANNIASRIINDTIHGFTGSVVLEKINLLTGKRETLNKKKISLRSNNNNTIKSKCEIKDNDLVISTIYDNDNNIVHRNYFISSEWKHVKCMKSKVTIKHRKESKSIVISAKSPVIFGDLYHKGISFEDRGFIILPGEKREIKYKEKSRTKLNAKNLRLFSLNDYLS